jgi:ABC-type transport system involved in cytochrome c biogenesis ATPase subunit
MGDVSPRGSIVFKNEAIAGLKPYEIAHRGIGYVPEDRAIFPTLTVEQNLILGVKAGKKARRWCMDDAYRLFPPLEARAQTPAGALSGGEQQMLTVCRTLMGDPDLLMVDEPTESRTANGRAGRRAFAQHRGTAHLDPSGGTEAHNRHAHLASRLRHGPWPHGVRRHACRTRGQCRSTPILAGSLKSRGCWLPTTTNELQPSAAASPCWCCEPQ